MDAERITQFQKQLSERLAVIQQILNRETLGRGEAQAEADVIDRASRSSETELFFLKASQYRRELGQIQQALRRIRESEYGDCMHCGQAIGLKRLQAVPWAQYCIDCQELLENYG